MWKQNQRICSNQISNKRLSQDIDLIKTTLSSTDGEIDSNLQSIEIDLNSAFPQLFSSLTNCLGLLISKLNSNYINKINQSFAETDQESSRNLNKSGLMPIYPVTLKQDTLSDVIFSSYSSTNESSNSVSLMKLETSKKHKSSISVIGIQRKSFHIPLPTFRTVYGFGQLPFPKILNKHQWSVFNHFY